MVGKYQKSSCIQFSIIQIIYFAPLECSTNLTALANTCTNFGEDQVENVVTMFKQRCHLLKNFDFI